MKKRQTTLQDALSQMVDKIEDVIKAFGYQGEPVKMILAGGMAVNYYCNSRYTDDVDATFSKKILLPYDELVVHYIKEDGTHSYLYFDTNYTPSLALMHENYEEDLIPYTEINRNDRLACFIIQLHKNSFKYRVL